MSMHDLNSSKMLAIPTDQQATATETLLSLLSKWAEENTQRLAVHISYEMKRRSPDDPDVQEVTQDVILELVKRVHTGMYDPQKATLSTYAMLIAQSKIVAFFANYRPMASLDDSLITEQMVVSETLKASVRESRPIEEALLTQQQREEVQQAINTLPLEQSQVMKLSLQGYCDQEIATRLHKTSGAIRTARSYALRALRRRFDATFL